MPQNIRQVVMADRCCTSCTFLCAAEKDENMRGVRDPVSRPYRRSGFDDPLSGRNAQNVWELKAGMAH